MGTVAASLFIGQSTSLTSTGCGGGVGRLRQSEREAAGVVGDTPTSADRRWWTLGHQPNEDPGAFYLRVRSTGLRRMDGLKTREEVVEQTILSRYLSLLPQDCYSSVIERRPKDGQAAARLVQEWEDTRGFARRPRQWRTGQHPYGHRGAESESQAGYNGSASNSGSRLASVPSSAGKVASTGNVVSSNSRVPSSQENPSRQASSGAGRSDRGNQRERKPVVCF